MSKTITHIKLPFYLKLGKPILAIVPEDSAVAEIIRETGAGVIIPSNSDWAKGIAEVLTRYKNNQLILKRNQEAIQKYSWENISKQWIETILEAMGQA